MGRPLTEGTQFAKLKLSLERVTLEHGGTSAVVEFLDDVDETGPTLRPDLRLALGVLLTSSEGMQLADWRAKVGELRGEVSEHTFAKWRKRLEREGLIETVAKGHLRLTEAGRGLLAPAELLVARSENASSSFPSPDSRGGEQQSSAIQLPV